MFGNSFYREFGEEPPELWCNAISRLTNPQLRRALVNLGNDGLSYPPNLSQFLAAAKRSVPVRYLGAAPSDTTDQVEKAWYDHQQRAQYLGLPESLPGETLIESIQRVGRAQLQ